MDKNTVNGRVKSIVMQDCTMAGWTICYFVRLLDESLRAGKLSAIIIVLNAA